MQHTGLGVRHVGGDGGQLQPGHEFLCRGPAALHAKDDHAAGPVGQVLLRPLVVLVPGQPGVLDPGDLVVALEILGHRLGVLTVLLHPQGKGLQPDVQQEAVVGGGNGAQVPHELDGGLGDVGPLQTEALGVGDSVIALIRGGQAGELVGVGVPVELAAVHDGAAYGEGVAVHILGGGVGDDVTAPLEGAAVHRGSEGIVHDKGNSVGMGRLGKLFDVQHGEGGVGDGLSKDRLGVGTEGGVQFLLRALGIHEGELDAHALHGDGKKVEGPTVDGGGGDDVVSAARDVEDGIEVGRLSGGQQHGGGAPLQGADLGRYRVVGGVLQSGIEVAAGLQVEQLAHLLAGLIAEGGGLDDGEIAGFAVAGPVAGVEAVGGDLIIAHGDSLFLNQDKIPILRVIRFWGLVKKKVSGSVSGDG